MEIQEKKKKNKVYISDGWIRNDDDDQLSALLWYLNWTFELPMKVSTWFMNLSTGNQFLCIGARWVTRNE